MKKDIKKQVLVIHGGNAFDTHEEYIGFLRAYEVTAETLWKAQTKRWKDTLGEDLGENFDVIFPTMPSAKNAKYLEWKIWFEKYLPLLGDDIVLVGHSLGANFLAKYLSEENISKKVASLHLVAGCYGCPGGFDLPESLKNIEKQVAAIVLYHSKDDEIVNYSDALKYSEALPSAELITFTDRGHFIAETFPEIVENIKKMS